MKLSCRLEVLPGASVREQFSQAADFGFDGVGLPGRMLDRYLTDLLGSLSDLPIPPMSLSLGFESSVLHPEATERRRCHDSLKRLMDICVELGVKRLNVPPVLNQDNPVRISEAGEFASLSERLDALFLEHLREIGEEAKQRQLIFLLEPVNRFESDYLHSIEHGARLCRQLAHDSVGMTVDAFHMQLEELSPEAAIRQAGETIRHVHIAENTRVEPGPGSLDLRGVFSGLRSLGYDDWIEVECRHLSGEANKVLPRSVEYVRALWKESESNEVHQSDPIPN